jgi:DedD protein
VNSRYQTDEDLQDLQDSRGQDREISLGATTILGIFLVLALLCAVFFGFGYSLGRRSAPPAVSAAETTTSSESSASKPAPGSPATHTALSSPAIQSDDASQPASLSDVPTTEPSQPSPAVTRVKAVAADFRPDTRTESAARPTTKPVSVASVAPAAAGVAVVQVAAVSHQEDADVLVNALKHRGYNVAIHKEPQDKLLHVQIGPFATKKDADAMRQRLQTDGYNAIVK